MTRWTKYLSKALPASLLFFFLSVSAFAGQTFNPLTNKPDFCVTIEEEDGSPSNKYCDKFKVQNGTLTDNGNKTFSFNIAGLLSSYVPYTGATGNVNLGAFSLTASNVSGNNTGDQTITLTGDVTGTGTGSFAATIANDAVTYAKMQNVSATDKILGRVSAGSGDVEEIACTSFARSILDDANEATFKATVNLEIGTDVQAYNAKLTDIAGLAVTDSNIIVGNGSTWVAESGATARTSLGLGTSNSPQFTAVNIGHASDTTLARVSAGVVSVEGVTVPLNSITNTHTAQQIELGHASDTTLSRSSAGIVAVEGVTVPLNSITNTHTAQQIELGHASDTTITRSAAGVIAVEGTSIPKGTGTSNEIAYWSGTNTVGSLAVATYPSLTELSYVKGVSSSIQTQLGGKQATLVSGTNIKTVNSNSLLGSGDVAVQPTLVSGTNIKTVNSTTLLGSGDIAITPNATHTGEVTGSGALTVDKTAITGKTAVTAASTDYLLISDTSDSGNLKKALASDFISGGTSDHSALSNLNWDDAGHTIDANVDFAGFEAIALACDNGSTLPSTPTQGQWFRHITTGRDILYQWNDTISEWVAIYSLADITFYVDGTGTDDLAHGHAVGTDAFDTIQYALDQIPQNKAPNTTATINIAAGTYAESVTIDTNYVTLQGAAFASASVSATCDSWTKGGTTSSGGPSPDILVDTGAFGATDYTGYFWTNDDTTFYPIVWNDADTLWIADNSITACTTYKIYPPPTTIINISGAGATPLTISSLRREIYVNNIKLTNSSTGTTYYQNAYTDVKLTNCHIQGGNIANGSFCGGTLNFLKSYVYETNASRYVFTVTAGRMVCTNSVIHASGSGSICIRQNQLGLTSGNPSFYRGNAGTTKGLILNQGGTTLFGQWFYNFSKAVQTDLSGLLVFENSLYATFNTCTVNIESPRAAWDASNLSIRQSSNVTDILKIGYDSTGDYDYINYGSSTSNKNITINNNGYVGINCEASVSSHDIQGSAAVGDVSGSSYTDFESDGTLHMTGNATTWFKQSAKYGEWDDDAESAPDKTNGFAGISRMRYQYFKDGSTQYIHFVLNLPADWLEGTEIYPFVNFAPVSEVAEGESPYNVHWELDYAWGDEGIVRFDQDTGTKTLEREISSCAAWEDFNTDLTDTIAPTGGQTIKSKIHFTLTRIVPEVGNDLETSVAIEEVGFWYQQDTLGARALASKTNP